MCPRQSRMVGVLRPAYACAIVTAQSSALYLEKRSLGARHAAGRLTCFGGRCEFGEAPAATLRRELNEELAWAPWPWRPRVAVDLWHDCQWVARFFHLSLPGLSKPPMRTYEARRACWVPIGRLHQAPISRWHHLVLMAWRSGQRRVVLPGR